MDIQMIVSVILLQVESNNMKYVNTSLQLIALTTVIAAIVYTALKFIRDIKEGKAKERAKKQESFELLVSHLTSHNKAAQLSAAILLREYLKNTDKDNQKDLQNETINVISSMLRILPTGVFQKTLADGLGFATDLSKCDLQKTNLQDVLLDNKNHEIMMHKTDLFLADLSYANLEGIIGHGIIFYNAVLFCTHLRNCDFTDANMRGADLSGVIIKDCILKGADFTNARNMPSFIKENLDENNRFTIRERVGGKHETKEKAVFFSMPGVMNKEDELVTKNYKELPKQMIL